MAQLGSHQTTCLALVGLLGVLSSVPGCNEDDGWYETGFGYAPRGWSTDVDVVFDPQVDFSEYQTFAFRADAEPDAAADELDPGTRRDLERVNARAALELSRLGLSEVAASEADLLAFSLGRTRSSSGVVWACVSYYYGTCTWREPMHVEVDRTTLMLGLQDATRSEVTFAGFISGIGGSERRRARQIAGAVDRIFDRYPARPRVRPDAGAPSVDAGVPGGDAGALPADTTPLGDAGADAGATSDAGP